MCVQVCAVFWCIVQVELPTGPELANPLHKEAWQGHQTDPPTSGAARCPLGGQGMGAGSPPSAGDPRSAPRHPFVLHRLLDCVVQ